jgi:hypothetical protein
VFTIGDFAAFGQVTARISAGLVWTVRTSPARAERCQRHWNDDRGASRSACHRHSAPHRSTGYELQLTAGDPCTGIDQAGHHVAHLTSANTGHAPARGAVCGRCRDEAHPQATIGRPGTADRSPAAERPRRARLVGMNEDVIAKAGSHPSAVPIGTLPDGIPAELAAALSTHGRAVYQEHDAVLQALLT